jgi:hypothetical protein
MVQHIQRTSGVFYILIEVQALCQALRIDQVKCGPRPQYPDSFIISLVIIRYLLGMNSERSFLRYLTNNHITIFTQLPEQSWFNRKCRRLIGVTQVIQQQLVMSHLQDTLRIIDSTPVPVVKRYRGASSVCFPRGKQTNYGYCASKKEYYYGVKLSLVMTEEGVITDLGIHAANTADINAAKSVLSEMNVTKLTLIGDKGYYDGELRTHLDNRSGCLVVPDKKRHHVFNTDEDIKLLKKRFIVETVNSQLKDHLRIEETLARSYQGLTTRLWGAVLAFTFAQYLNRKTGRPLLAVKSVLV